MAKTLRIGLLGASRIAQEAIIAPAKALGHALVGVAARDESRAAAFAEKNGVAAIRESYEELLADPNIDLVYNGLINSAHATWNIAALRAGKHVLGEKPMTGNARTTAEVIAAAEQTGNLLVEGFHYIHHPVHQRMEELVRSGLLGTVERITSTLAIPAPADSDPRWDYELSGGATMDIGCYVLDAMRNLGSWIDATVQVSEATPTLKAPRVDSAMDAKVEFSNGVIGACRWDMAAPQREMTWTIHGSEGSVTSHAFAMPHNDPRLTVTIADQKSQERFESHTSYVYQLRNIETLLQSGAPYPREHLAGSQATADLVDQAYDAAGLPLRPK